MTTRRNLTGVALIVLALALVAGLVVGVASLRGGGGDPAGDEPTAWQKVMDSGPDSGETTVDMARQAFSLAFEPLPGVDVPSGSTDDILSGSAAIRMMVTHWAELTDGERVIAQSWLQPGGRQETSGETGIGTLSPGGQMSAFSTRRSTAVGRASAPVREAEIRTRMNELKAELGKGGRVGTPLTFETELFFNSTQIEGKSSGYTFPHSVDQVSTNPTPTTARLSGATGLYGGCFIFLNPNGWGKTGANLDFVLVHELFHCFEGMLIGDLKVFYDPATAPGWVLEGGVNWAAAQLAPTAMTTTELWWRWYLLGPEIPLDEIPNSAMGFWNHLEESTDHDPWKAIPASLGQTSAAAFAASGATEDKFLDSWGSSYFRQPAFGSEWDTRGPTMAVYQKSPQVGLIANGGQDSWTTAGYKAVLFGSEVLYADIQADTVLIVAVGHVTMHNNAENASQFGQRVYCVREQGCDCPPGSVNTTTAPPPLGGRSIAFGLSGGLTASELALQGISLEEWCKLKNPPEYTRPTPRTPDGADAELCHQIVEREGIDGLLNNPSMDYQDIQDCVEEILDSGGFGSP